MENDPTGTGAKPTGGGGAGRSRFRRTATGVALAASMAVGGLAVAAVNPLGEVGAETTTTVAGQQPDGAGVTADGARAGAEAERSARVKVLDTALDSLVADGTLTQAQADAVTTRVKNTAKLVHGERRDRRVERRKAMASTAAESLGVSTGDLVTLMRDGATIAEIAEQQDVDVQKVIDALEGEAKAAIDKAVADGKVPAERADGLVQRANEWIERFVNEGPRHPRGGS